MAPSFKVWSVSELQSALDSANPGDRITLAPGYYQGSVSISRSGSRNNPIRINGTGTMFTGSGTGIRISGNYVDLSNFTFAGFDTAVLVQGSGNDLSNLIFNNSGGNAIHIKGSRNQLDSSVVNGGSVQIDGHDNVFTNCAFTGARRVVVNGSNNSFSNTVGPTPVGKGQIIDDGNNFWY